MSKLSSFTFQVADKLNWPNRSLSYLCRSFDQLNESEDYRSVKPVIHIGFLDYTLFKAKLEFYATYKLMKTSNSKLTIGLLSSNLKHGRKSRCSLKKNEYINEASKSIFQMTADELVRKRCRDREDYYSSLRSYEETIAEKDALML